MSIESKTRCSHQRQLDMKQRRRIRQENMFMLVAICCYTYTVFSLPAAEGFSSSKQQHWRKCSYSKTTSTSRYATIENENMADVSSSSSSSDSGNGSNDDDNSLKNSLQRQHSRQSDELWYSQDLDILSSSAHDRESDNNNNNNVHKEEPFFARKITNGANGASSVYHNNKNGVSNGVSLAQKNGASVNTKNGFVMKKKYNGVHSSSSPPASPQPAPVTSSASSYQDDIQGRIQREHKVRQLLEEEPVDLPGLLNIIEEMSQTRNRTNSTAASPQTAEKVPAPAPDILSTPQEESSSMFSSVSSIFFSATEKVRNGWRRVTPFGTTNNSSPQVEAIPDSQQKTSLSLNNTTTKTSSSTSGKKKRSKEEVMVARMSRKKKKQLSNLLNKVNKRTTKSLGGITARTLSGLISAVAEEVEGLSVQLHAQEDTPFWRKQIDSVSIEFTRLGFKPLHMGGPDQLIQYNDDDKELQKERTFKIKQQQEELKRELLQTQQQTPSSIGAKDDDYEMEDECPVDYATDEDGNTIATLSCADTAFQQIDVDNSGALDKDEIADALVLAASSMEAKQSSGNRISGAVADLGASSRKVIQGLAKQLVDLYDINNDGVIDRSEYQHMVEDMAALRQVQKEREQKRKEQLRQEVTTKGNSWWSSAINFISRGNSSDSEELDEVLIRQLNGDSVVDVTNSTMGEELMNMAGLSDEIPQTLGKIELENLKMDMRQVLFGALPLIKRITPGGPLFLEPFTVKITGSFSAEDIMKSSLLDAGLRQLVSFALRRRVRSFRDLTDGAVFHGRKWKRDSVKAPLVECTELTSVEIDDKDRLIVTGRAKVRASEDAPVIDNSFKLRTRIANPRNGRAIKLSDPEIAIVLECPREWENSLNSTFAKFNMKAPSKPRPIYTYIPIQSPFNKDDDTGGYYMGEDNCIKSIYVKDKCLRFELETILRPGRFLGNHYLAFTVPQRALIITVDRVKNGIRAARRRKKALQAMLKARTHDIEEKAHHAEDALATDAYDDYERSDGSQGELESESAEVTNGKKDKAQSKGFISRFVDGYLQAGAGDEKEKLTVAISDWFGRQGASDSENSVTGSGDTPTSQDGVTAVVENIAMEHIMDDDKPEKESS